MLFTTAIFSILALAALGSSAPAVGPAELEDRGSKPKYYCETKYSGKLTGPGVGGGKTFPFTKSGSLVTYSGTKPPSKDILNVEFQACSNATIGGPLMKDQGDWVGRLRVKGTKSCIDLSVRKGVFWLPKIVTCNTKKLTDAQTWRYDPGQFNLFWAGYFYFGHPDEDVGEVCRGGYEHNPKGTPVVTSKKQIQVNCAGDDLQQVQFWKLVK